MKPTNFEHHSGAREKNGRSHCGGFVVAEERCLNRAVPLRLSLLASLLLLLAAPSAFAALPNQVDPVDPATFVGNVYGVVSDQSTGAPVADARVAVLDEIGKASLLLCISTHDPNGWLVQPDCIQRQITAHATRAERAQSDGAFLINFVPAPGDGRDYTLAIAHPSHRLAVVDVHVLPGAAMALEVTAQLVPAGDAAASKIFVRYRHEVFESRDTESEEGTGRSSASVIRPAIFRGSIFSTREGLVGGTTANGHVIVPNDRFAALPSRRALSSNFGHEREVRVSYRGRTTVVPVWDVGPWNTHDDYWNPPNIRETFKDLPMGKPEAEAAFYDRYNNGLDERGRVVRTPAGIDLADGTFWLDLGMTNNDRVDVEYLWVDADGPIASGITVAPDPVISGGSVKLEATASDAATGNAPIAAVEFFFDSIGDSGTGIAASANDGSFDSPIETVRGAAIAALSPGRTHTIFIHARDVYGNWGPFASVTFGVIRPPRQRAVSH